jgi:hypothetical protein
VKTIPAKLILTPSKFRNIDPADNEGETPVRLPDHLRLPLLNGGEAGPSRLRLVRTDALDFPQSCPAWSLILYPVYSHTPASKKVESMPRRRSPRRSPKKPALINPGGGIIVVSSDSDVPSIGKTVAGSKTGSRKFRSRPHHDEDIIDQI